MNCSISSWRKGTALVERLKAEMRATYRTQWNRPGMRHVLSRGWNEMMLDPEIDLGIPRGGRGTGDAGMTCTEGTANMCSVSSSAWRVVKSCALEVYEEYQGQLTNLQAGTSNRSNVAKNETEHCSRCVFNTSSYPTPNMLVLEMYLK
jgi:hypothetical protein